MEIDFPEMQEKLDEQQELQRVYQEIDGIEVKIIHQGRILSALDSFSPDICEKLLTEQEILSELKSEVMAVEDNYLRGVRELEDRNTQLKEVESELDALDICEVCGAEKKNWNMGVKK